MRRPLFYLSRAVLCFALLAGLAGAEVASAQSLAIVLSEIPCLPMEGNSPVFAAVSPASVDHQVRLYFRRQDFGDYYYLVMQPMGGGNYWVVLPKPERQNEVVEYHVTVLTADGQILSSTVEQGEKRVTVIRDCEAKLSSDQEEASESLAIGETNAAQKGKPVGWFLCDGITHRIDTEGRLRADEFCSVPPGPHPIIEGGDSSPGGGTPGRDGPGFRPPPPTSPDIP